MREQSVGGGRGEPRRVAAECWDPGQDLIFPDFLLEPGQACHVHTNEIQPETCGFSFHSRQAIWNNKGDCGYLYDASRALVSQYCY